MVHSEPFIKIIGVLLLIVRFLKSSDETIIQILRKYKSLVMFLINLIIVSKYIWFDISKTIAMSKMKILVASLVCGLQPTTNVIKNCILGVSGSLDSVLELNNVFRSLCKFQIKQSCWIVVIILSMTTFLPSSLISNNGKYLKASILPQLKNSTIVWTPIFPHEDHSVTLLLFLDFSLVLEISGSFSKQTLFTSKLSGSY